MDISIREYRQADVITIHGRVDSLSAEQLSQAIAGAHQRGKYNLVLDMIFVVRTFAILVAGSMFALWI
jgi:hypothetical protein